MQFWVANCDTIPTIANTAFYVCMCVCYMLVCKYFMYILHVCTYMNIYVCIFVFICVCVCVCMYLCMSVYKYVCVYVCMSLCMCAGLEINTKKLFVICRYLPKNYESLLKLTRSDSQSVHTVVPYCIKLLQKKEWGQKRPFCESISKKDAQWA